MYIKIIEIPEIIVYDNNGSFMPMEALQQEREIFMKLRILIISIFLLNIIFLSGCNNETNQELINQLKPKDGKYNIHLFYAEIGDSNIEMGELQSFMNSNPNISDIMHEAGGHPYNKSLVKKLKKLGVNQYPVYLLIDSSGIKLKTPYLSEVKEYIRQELKLKN
jgi:hypothetical protein